MAQMPACDICGQENAVQMLTSFVDGATFAIGPACTPMFFGQLALQAFEAGEHKGPATKCQACRRFHERMTTPVAAINTEYDDSVPGAIAEAPPETAAETP